MKHAALHVYETKSVLSPAPKAISYRLPLDSVLLLHFSFICADVLFNYDSTGRL